VELLVKDNSLGLNVRQSHLAFLFLERKKNMNKEIGRRCKICLK